MISDTPHVVYDHETDPKTVAPPGTKKIPLHIDTAHSGLKVDIPSSRSAHIETTDELELDKLVSPQSATSSHYHPTTPVTVNSPLPLDTTSDHHSPIQGGNTHTLDSTTTSMNFGDDGRALIDGKHAISSGIDYLISKSGAPLFGPDAQQPDFQQTSEDSSSSSTNRRRRRKHNSEQPAPTDGSRRRWRYGPDETPDVQTEPTEQPQLPSEEEVELEESKDKLHEASAHSTVPRIEPHPESPPTKQHMTTEHVEDHLRTSKDVETIDHTGKARNVESMNAGNKLEESHAIDDVTISSATEVSKVSEHLGLTSQNRPHTTTTIESESHSPTVHNHPPHLSSDNDHVVVESSNSVYIDHTQQQTSRS